MKTNGHHGGLGRGDIDQRLPAVETIQWPEIVQDFSSIPGLGGPASAPQKSPVDYVRRVLSRKWVIVSVFFVAVLLGVAYVLTATPYYVSRATVEIEKMRPRSENVAEMLSMYGQFDVYYRTQVQSLRSRGVAEEFLTKLREEKNGKIPGLTPDDPGSSGGMSFTGEAPSLFRRSESLFRELLHGSPQPLNPDSLVSRIKVFPIPETQLIEVELEANSPTVARDLLAGYLETFVEMSRRKAGEMTDRVRVWMQKELVDARKQLDESEAALLEFTKKHSIVFSKANPNEVMSLFERAGDSLLKTKSDRLNLEAMSKSGDKAVFEADSSYLQVLKKQLTELQAQYANMKSIYSPSYFKMALLRNKIETLQKTIGEMERSSIDSELEAARQREKVSEETYEKTKQDAIQTNSLAVQYDILRKAVEANSQLYLIVLQKSKQAELDLGVNRQSAVITSPPSLPISPSRPQKSKIILLAAVIGLIGGIGLAACLEFMSDTVHTTQDIQMGLNIPILGTVPKLGRDNKRLQVDSNGTPLEFVAHKYPSSPFTEAVRIIQDAASASMAPGSPSSMCISSALPMEGKTLLTVVMGTVIASEGKRVLIIDCDLRRPRIHEVFGCPDCESGLTDLLSGKSTELRKIIRVSDIPGLYFMTAGAIPDNPVALLKNPRMQEIVEECKKIFDMVILDSPPMLGVVDARILSGYVDGMILVSRAGHTPLDILRQAKEALADRQGRLLGIVLNMTDRRADNYSRYYSRYYSRKGSDQDAA